MNVVNGKSISNVTIWTDFAQIAIGKFFLSDTPSPEGLFFGRGGVDAKLTYITNSNQKTISRMNFLWQISSIFDGDLTFAQIAFLATLILLGIP